MPVVVESSPCPTVALGCSFTASPHRISNLFHPLPHRWVNMWIVAPPYAPPIKIWLWSSSPGFPGLVSPTVSPTVVTLYLVIGTTCGLPLCSSNQDPSIAISCFLWATIGPRWKIWALSYLSTTVAPHLGRRLLWCHVWLVAIATVRSSGPDLPATSQSLLMNG
jgi:hypothetical protein